MSWLDQIALESNVVIRAEERGKLRRNLCRDFKNIWTYKGREWVTQLMSYQAAAPPPDPPAFANVDRAAMMGFGVGGNQQTILPIGGAIDADYPGLNVQDDTDPNITYLERPVRILTGAPDPYWLRRFDYVQTAWGDPLPSTTRYVRWFGVFDYGEIDGPWGYSMVPLSEIGLFTSEYFGAGWETSPLATVYTAVSPYVGVRPEPIAYHTFPSIPKTGSIKLTVRWEVRVGG